jgi:hypothetical protein
LLISICFGLYFLLPSVFKDDERGHRASIAAQHNPKLSNVDGLVNLITSAPDLNEGKILKIEAEPGSFYLTVIDSSGTTQLLRTASISQGTLFGKLDINQNVRWRALAEDTNYFSKHLNKHFDRGVFQGSCRLSC